MNPQSFTACCLWPFPGFQAALTQGVLPARVELGRNHIQLTNKFQSLILVGDTWLASPRPAQILSFPED